MTVSNSHYLDKDGPTREATAHHDSVVVPIGKVAEPRPRARPERVGVLLVNLGTPDSADARGVRVYLKEFLSDPARDRESGPVLEADAERHHPAHPRPRRKARDYLKIWNTEKNESPLKTITRAQAEKLGAGDRRP